VQKAEVFMISLTINFHLSFAYNRLLLPDRRVWHDEDNNLYILRNQLNTRRGTDREGMECCPRLGIIKT